MKKKFTIAERTAGELAERRLSPEIREFIDGTDQFSLFEYIDYDATAQAEEEADANDIEYWPGELDVVRYAVSWCGSIESNLTFEQVETFLQGLVNASKEEEED